MSILLEALRKSENSQKPVEPATIHDSDHAMESTGSIRSSYVILLIAIALLIIGWLLWKQYHGAESAYSPPVSLPVEKGASKAPKSPAKNESALAASGTDEKPEATQAARPAQKTANAANNTANNANSRPRTPVETYKLSKEEKEAIRQERASLRRQKIAADNKAKREAAAKAAAANAEPKEPAKAKPVAKQDEGGKKPIQEYQSPEPEPIGYWELPDSVRNGVPEIKFSVLVYADNPNNRFVLVNGTRLVEGDALKPGVVVEEIRRNGVIFSYRMYRFFVER